MIRILLTLAALATPAFAGAQPTVTEQKCDIGNIVVDGECQPVMKYSHPIGTYTINRAVIAPSWEAVPKCPPGYELVLRSPSTAVCARDFAEPVR